MILFWLWLMLQFALGVSHAFIFEGDYDGLCGRVHLNRERFWQSRGWLAKLTAPVPLGLIGLWDFVLYPAFSRQHNAHP